MRRALLVLSLLWLLSPLSLGQVRPQVLSVYTDTGTRQCDVRGIGIISRSISVLTCSWDQARWEVGLRFPEKHQAIYEVPFPKNLKIQLGTIRDPVFGLCLGLTKYTWGGRLVVMIGVSGDIIEDMDTEIHEFEHYLTVMILEDWDFHHVFHNEIDSRSTLWRIMRTGEISR